MSGIRLMRDILRLMDKDHAQIETLFTKIKKLLENKDPASINLFNQFHQALQKHFIWEENILFPPYEEKNDLSGKDTIFVLRSEHKQMRIMFIHKIEKLIKTSRYKDLEPVIIGLDEMLTMHKQMEVDIFYPWFNEILSTREVDIIVDDFKEMKRNGNKNKRP